MVALPRGFPVSHGLCRAGGCECTPSSRIPGLDPGSTRCCCGSERPRVGSGSSPELRVGGWLPCLWGFTVSHGLCGISGCGCTPSVCVPGPDPGSTRCCCGSEHPRVGSGSSPEIRVEGCAGPLRGGGDAGLFRCLDRHDLVVFQQVALHVIGRCLGSLCRCLGGGLGLRLGSGLPLGFGLGFCLCLGL